MKRILTVLIFGVLGGCIQSHEPTVYDGVVLGKDFELSARTSGDSQVPLTRYVFALKDDTGTVRSLDVRKAVYDTVKVGQYFKGADLE